MRHVRLPFLLLVAATTIISCSKSGPTTVESITLSRDDGNGKAGEQVESLKPRDHEFHADVTLDKGDDAKVNADLIAVDTPEGKDIKVLSKEYDLKGAENIVNLTFSLPRDWPAGTYRVDVQVNGKPGKSKDFKIE